MDRLFAYIGNDASLVRCAVCQSKEALSRHLAGQTTGWGMGYEQESQFLLRKRPQAPDLDLMAVASDLRSQAFAIHVPDPAHLPPRQTITPADMPPFRFRSWLFTHTGSLGAYAEHRDAMELPDFLTRNIRGGSASELLFHRFLVHLKNERVSLQHPVAPVRATTTALARTLAEARRWASSADQDAEALRVGVVLINGRNLILGSIGDTFRVYTVKGGSSCALCEGQPLFAGHRPRKVRHDHLRAVMVTSQRAPEGTADPGEAVTDGQIAAVGADWLLKRFTMDELLAPA